MAECYLVCSMTHGQWAVNYVCRPVSFI